MKTFLADGSVRRDRRVLSCFVDESGSPERSEPRPYRIGFLLTCRSAELESDLRALKREISPRSKTGQFHAREDAATTRVRLLQLLAMHPEPQLYVVEWRKETFSDRWFRSGRLTVFSDTNLAFGSVALAASEFVSAAAGGGFSVIQFSVEANLADTRSEHRGRSQAMDTVLRARLQGLPVRSRVPRTAVVLSTVRKKDCELLALVDVWLWALGANSDEPENLPESLRSRTTITLYDGTKLGDRVSDEWHGGADAM